MKGGMSNTPPQRQIICYHSNDKALLQICSWRETHISFHALCGASGLKVEQFVREQDNCSRLWHTFYSKSHPIKPPEWFFLVQGKKGDVGEEKDIISVGEERLKPTEEAEMHRLCNSSLAAVFTTPSRHSFIKRRVHSHHYIISRHTLNFTHNVVINSHHVSSSAAGFIIIKPS